ncbi:retropepsin-like aspartic protease [Ureibacillus terrenus]|uniref:retropepsin-like aspartic protease n=1 Tax=Ureibacillus terrenus TaxID=118246 RepID=UPI002E221EBB|nr:retropepsin-like aspartic protease [Ureibacillus terrenus]
MQLIFENGLLLSTIEICYKGKRKCLNRVAIDSGSSHSFIDIDSVQDLGVAFENGDPIVRHFGIGGSEYSFSKILDYVKIGEKTFHKVLVDFGPLREWDIHGLIGLDILKSGEFLLDLKHLKLITMDERKLA